VAVVVEAAAAGLLFVRPAGELPVHGNACPAGGNTRPMLHCNLAVR